MEKKALLGMRIVSYLLYALLLICVLLYVRFPTEKFKRFAELKIEEAFQGTDVRVGKFKLHSPFKITLDKIIIVQQTAGDEILRFENIQLRPILTGFGLEYAFSGAVYDGTFSGELRLTPRGDTFDLDDIQLLDMDIARSEYLRAVSRREISGKLDFIGEYSGTLSGTGEPEVQGVLAIKDGGFALMQPVLSLRMMDMESVECGVSYSKGTLSFVEGDFKGKDIHADFEGSVQISPNVELSTVVIRGNMVPSKAFLKEKPQVLRVVKRLQKQYRKTALPFSISGTMGNPRFRFGTL